MWDSEPLEKVANAITTTTTLKSLDLSKYENENDEGEFVILCKAIEKNTSLTSVTISCSTAVYNLHCISEMLKQRQDLKELVSFNIQLSQAECAALSEVLKSHKSLETFSLVKTHMAPADIHVLCQGLKINRSIRSLSFEDCGLGDDDIESVFTILAVSQTLEKLSIYPNNASGRSIALMLLRVVEENDTLTYMNAGPKPHTGKGLGKGGFRYHGNSFQDDEIYKLEEKLKNNYSLTYLNYESAKDMPSIAIQKLLTRNAEYQQHMCADLMVLMHNIARYQSYSSSSTLPREIWIEIFKFVRVPGRGWCSATARKILTSRRPNK